MNQILVTNDKQGAQVILMKPVIKFFCVVALIFAFILVGEGAYNLYASFSNGSSYPAPVLIPEKNGSDIALKISSEVGISKVLYSWNDGEQMEYKGEGRKTLSFEIAIPQGDNILNISVVDIEGNKTRFEGIPVKFSEAEDTKKPRISIENDNGKLVITATDETELDYLTYQWEDGEEIKVEASENDKKTIKQEIKIQNVDKTLTMIAVDKAGNKETTVKKITNSNESYPVPVLTTEIAGNIVKINISSGVEIDKVLYSWNGKEEKEYKADNKMEVSFELDIPEGDNVLKVAAIDVEGIRTTFDDVSARSTGIKDTTKPRITVENASGKLIITATDETELDYLTYQWEDGEVVKTEATEGDKKSIKQEVGVEKGTKSITIIAVDKSGNQETVKKKIVGSNGAEIKVTLSDGNFVVRVTDEYKITKIQYTLNDEEFTVNDIPENAKEYEFRVPLKEGITNYLKINAYENDLMTEYKCKKTY